MAFRSTSDDGLERDRFAELALLGAVFGNEKENDEVLDDLDDEIDFKLFQLGMEFLRAVRRGRYSDVERIAYSGFNVNFLHPMHGKGALHDIAYGGSKRLLRAFLRADGIDFLIPDKSGRYASEIASIHNRDRVIARFLRMRERIQARRDDVELPHLDEPR
ncbi:MAG: hypothetical protein AAF416_12215 [Pseudomonadota bacterium]